MSPADLPKGKKLAGHEDFVRYFDTFFGATEFEHNAIDWPRDILLRLPELNRWWRTLSVCNMDPIWTLAIKNLTLQERDFLTECGSVMRA
eukprot:8166399-Alexandrium_andersonii.AAC.1